MAADSTQPGKYWAVALTVIIVVLIIVAAGLFVMKRTTDLPGEATDRAVEALSTVAEAFRSGNVTTTFISYATTVTGNSYFQFATLRQMEIFERKDERTTFWIPLPDVIVEARAPVEYTYFVDLRGEWKIAKNDRSVDVQAPAIQFNMPAVDASKIEYTVKKGSIFRREDAVLEALKQSITNETRQRAAENIALVREEGRKQIGSLISSWMAREFSDGEAFAVNVRFPGETEGVTMSHLEPERQ